MPDTRRSFIKKSFSISAYTAVAAHGLLTTSAKAAWPREKFAEIKVEETIKRLYGTQKISASNKIKLKLPRIAENGSVVPITVSCNLKNVQSIALLVEKNPVPLTAQFKLTPAADGFVSARLKMAETCDVIAIVRADDKLYSAKQAVKVTIGGCGG